MSDGFMDRPLSLNERYMIAWEDGTLTPELEHEWKKAMHEAREAQDLAGSARADHVGVRDRVTGDWWPVRRDRLAESLERYKSLGMDVVVEEADDLRRVAK